ncbi:MAG: DUF4012 domain-containing protein [Actinomycetota bacterium]
MLAVLAGIAALAYRPAVDARDHLFSARDAMLDGRAALLEGDAERANEGFLRAKAEFVQARAAARNPVLRAIGWLPVVGRTPDTVASLAEAGVLMADAGSSIATAIVSLPGGASALAPRDGAFDLSVLPPLAEATTDATATTSAAIAVIDGSADSFLLGPVADARAETRDQLVSLHASLASAAGVLQALPSLMGEDGPRRYFFGAASPSELRGSGGFVGAFSVMTLDAGAITFEPFRSILDLPSFDLREIEPPSEDYATNYDRFGGAAFWQNVNMTPDFPSAAVAIERLYERGTGEALDGVVLADPFVLEALLRATGPVEAPSLGTTLTAEDVVAFTANRAYSEFEDSTTRKIALGEAAAAVFAGFMSGQGSPFDGAVALARATGDGHLSVYSSDPSVQEALETAGVAGSLSAPPGDFLSVVQNNAAANKVDYYVDRRVSYSIQLGAEGRGVATVGVELANGAPLTGASTYVLGPHAGASDRGEHVSYTTVYCAATCEMEGATRDDAEEPQQIGSELGFTTLQTFLRLPSGASTTLSYRLALPEAWEGDDESGTYRLTFLNQPTIRPTTLDVEVHVPEGMEVAWSNVFVDVSGENVHWSGVPGRRFTLELRFARPWADRWWSSVLGSSRSPA